ncbi:HAD family hydrolase [Brachybacterium sp. AOP43-C2-M15]|uniref:HAD family hydrolase n=1 Tax=Brachybacterium sp. AOP43-C2-M15 TaxID=3457661 RepID=UPI0040336492
MALATQLRPTDRPVVVFDFDGTVCLGDGPVLAYAQEAFAGMPADAADAAQEAFERWMSGDRAAAPDAPDAYVALAAIARPVLGEDLHLAYLASRERLRRDPLGIHPPEGLGALLDDLGAEGCARVLLTNSPAVGMEEALDALGVRDRFDQIVIQGRKRRLMEHHLLTVLGGQDPRRLVSVGDNLVNDVSPALRIGARGLLITGAWGSSDVTGTVHGAQLAPTLAEHAPALRDFAQMHC